MADNQNTSDVLAVAVERASEFMQNPDSDAIRHYPMLWIYAAATGKDWDQIRTDASNRFVRSLTTHEGERFLAVLDSDPSTAYRNTLEYFSMFLYCKMKNAGSVRCYKWTALELALTCPENNEAFRLADFQEQIDDSIAYLDLDIQ